VPAAGGHRPGTEVSVPAAGDRWMSLDEPGGVDVFVLCGSARPLEDPAELIENLRSAGEVPVVAGDAVLIAADGQVVEFTDEGGPKRRPVLSGAGFLEHISGLRRSQIRVIRAIAFRHEGEPPKLGAEP
jgi:hypothetical protein